MGANKKKKKPATNPARGVATTSLPSKNKVKTSEDTTPVAPDAITQEHISDVIRVESVAEGVAEQTSNLPATHSMTAAQLEEHLERAELQSALEMTGSRAKKDAHRIATKLQTDRRILRPQADCINTSLFESDFQNQVLELARLEQTSPDAHSMGSERFTMSEIDHVMYNFTLQIAINELGLPFHDDVLQHVSSSNAMTVTKDLLWGVNEYLYWLALHLGEPAMPDYDRRPVRNHTETTAAELERSPERCPADEATGRVSRSDRSGTVDATNVQGGLYQDSEDEMDPDQLTERYLDMKFKIFDLERNLPDIDASLVALQKRLQSKLSKIEHDVLFDRDEAVELWRSREIELRKSMPISERRLLRQDDPFISKGPDDLPTVSDVMDHEDDGEVFGSIFEEAEGYGASMEPQSRQTDDESTIFLHDFGKWTGGPRKILEEACKIRDPNYRLHCRLSSPTSRRYKHTIRVQFSKDQEELAAAAYHPPHVTFSCSPREIELSMTTIATPTNDQSEAYISTVALWVIFSTSTKGERPSLRLPSVWRQVWDDLSKQKQAETDAEDLRALETIREMIRRQPIPEKSLPRNSLRPHSETRSNRTRKDFSEMISQQLDWASFWQKKTLSPAFQKMLESRKDLPIYNARTQIIDELAGSPSRCLILCGETGSGKSTQVPSYLLEHELSSGRDCRILVTEPRRISAISLARRVSEELGEMKNEIGSRSSLIGYAIRLESKMSSATRITFATTGVVMRMLEHKDVFNDLNYLVIDEVHERAIDTDFLLIVLRRLLKDRSNLRIILMSATVNAEKFARYFANDFGEVPIVNVPGRTYPVEIKYLEDIVEMTHYVPNKSKGSANVDEDFDEPESDSEATKTYITALKRYSNHTRDVVSKFDEYRIDYDLILKTILFVANDSRLQIYSRAFLIFLPGIAEIRRMMYNYINSSSYFDSGWEVNILHSSISGQEQERAFVVPGRGIRKIVLSTNIAETGVTIPDITTVIDTGKEKIMRFDERRQMSKLTESFISRASSRQRQGRAARVQAGLCMKLYTRDRHDRLMSEQTIPEMLRLSLQEPVLRVKLYNLGNIEATLSQALDAPPPKAIHRAVTALKEINALTPMEELTQLGRQLARLPLDVYLGKMMMLGFAFKCLDCVVSIAAIITSKSPFLSSDQSRAAADKARLAFKRGDSDLLLLWNVYTAWRRAAATSKAQDFLRKNLLSGQVLSLIEDQKTQLLVSLVEAGLLLLDEPEISSLRRARFTSGRSRQFFDVPARYNTNSENDTALLSAIASAFYPKLLIREGKGWRNIATNQNVSIAPVSTLRSAPPDQMPKWLSFYQSTQTKSKNVLVHDVTPVEDLAVALFLGDAEFKLFAGIITIDNNRVRFAVKNLRTMVALKVLRTKIQALITHTMHSPKSPLSQRMQNWADIWQRLMEDWAKMKDKKKVVHV